MNGAVKDADAPRDGRWRPRDATPCRLHRLESPEDDPTAVEDELAEAKVDLALTALACVFSPVLALTAPVRASAPVVSAVSAQAVGHAEEVSP